MLSFPFTFTPVHIKPPQPHTLQRPSTVSATATPPQTYTSSLYEVLGISTRATSEEIKVAYRKLARSCHPDVAIAGSSDDFMKVNAAYSILSDPVKRAEYDQKILRPPGRRFPGLSGSTTSSFCQFPRRNWETDQCW